VALTERTRYELVVPMSVDDVRAALTDFTDRRPRIWRETSDPKVYRLHALQPTGADVTEGAPFAWSRERYDWADPLVVRLTQVESNVAKPVGTIVYGLTDINGGCRIICERYREFRPTIRGRLAHAFMSRLGPSILRRQLRSGLKRYARELNPG